MTGQPPSPRASRSPRRAAPARRGLARLEACAVHGLVRAPRRRYLRLRRCLRAADRALWRNGVVGDPTSHGATNFSSARINSAATCSRASSTGRATPSASLPDHHLRLPASAACWVCSRRSSVAGRPGARPRGRHPDGDPAADIRPDAALDRRHLDTEPDPHHRRARFHPGVSSDARGRHEHRRAGFRRGGQAFRARSLSGS